MVADENVEKWMSFEPEDLLIQIAEEINARTFAIEQYTNFVLHDTTANLCPIASMGENATVGLCIQALATHNENLKLLANRIFDYIGMKKGNI